MNFLNLSVRTKMVFIGTGIFIGLLVSVQIKSSVPNSSFIFDQLEAQKSLIKSYLDDQAVLKSRIVSLRKGIEESQAGSKIALEQTNLEILQNLKKEIGLVAVKGEGVILVLNDGQSIDREKVESMDQSLIHASDLRDVVNLLRAAKADAIAINDQRVIAASPISSVGNTILVNNTHLLPPFTIVAIGDPEVIKQQLADPAALPDLQKRVKGNKVQFTVQNKGNLSVPEYVGTLTLNFLKPDLKNADES